MRSKNNGLKINNKILIIIIAVLVVFIIGFGFLNWGIGPVDKNDQTEITVEIPNGTGTSAIVQILNDNGLVKNLLCARVAAKFGGYTTPQANNYVFKKSMTFREMMSAINTGDFNYVSKQSIEVKDGYRLEQIAEAMASVLPFEKKQILDTWSNKDYLKQLIQKYWFLTEDILDKKIKYPLEGYLYADTYFVTTQNATIESFTEMCLDRMDKELTPRKDKIKASKFSIHKLLTLTSIVTKESRAEDQAEVAGVFMNRLKKKMSLGSDVTVCYIYQEDRVELKQSQLSSDSPYNTRKVEGLPPGPICSIVADAIDATLDYKKTDNLFFFADDKGVVHFYKTEAEFEKGIEKEGLLKDDKYKDKQ